MENASAHNERMNAKYNFLFVSVENSTGYPTVRRRRVTALYFAHVSFNCFLDLTFFIVGSEKFLQ